MLIAYSQFIAEMPQHYCACMLRIRVDCRQEIERACGEPDNAVPPVQVAGLAEDLRYGEMVKLMTYLERDAKDFYLEVNETVAALHPIRCTKQHRLEIPIDLTQGVAGVTVIAVVLWMLLRRRRVKPKIN
jgi:hypothetical protein